MLQAQTLSAAHPELRTQRLRLVAVDAAAAELQLNDPDSYFAAWGVPVPAAWPPLPFDLDVLDHIALSLRAQPDAIGWYSWVFFTEHHVIGAGGFTGPPDSEGEIELGYGLLDGCAGQGFGQEAALALVDWAMASPATQRVVCHALAEPEGGAKALARLGFRPDGAGPYPGVARFLLTR